MRVRLFEKFLGTRGHSVQEFGQEYSVTHHTFPVDAQSSDGEKHTGNSERQNACGVSHGREIRRSHGPSNHESRTADIYTNQTGLAQWRNSWIGYENTLRGPRSCWRNEICSSRSSSGRTSVLLARSSEQNSARTKIWKKVEVWDYCCQRPHGCYHYWYLHFPGKRI